MSAANGKAVLQLLEDVTGHRVIREAETVLLKVEESAYRGNIPGGTPGAPSGYVLPLTQDPALIWPGWETFSTAGSGYTDVSINVTGVDGPGRVYMYTQGSFGDFRPLLTHGGYSFPGTIREAEPAHTHAQWVFSQKGVYKLTVHAVATNPKTGSSIRTAAHTYVFQVGDVPLGDAFCGLRSADAGTAAVVNAAVHQSTADAVAAAQADAAAQAAAAEAEEKEKRKQTLRTKQTEGEDEDNGVLDAIFGEDVNPAVVGGIVGGGVLIIAGIIGATLWCVRRLRTQAAPVDTTGSS
ncbi:hypothetical protein FM104_01930 [Microbacterium esteraromaticum]|uniref:Surface-anchored protein n=1 Tax=Microbacterium esteraromaticum TaxID=57043 RepID=A0A1R4IH71_9MICO|nr:hypothetical protein FM104_01930 [Microbacterium esteraromaticum]